MWMRNRVLFSFLRADELTLFNAILWNAREVITVCVQGFDGRSMGSYWCINFYVARTKYDRGL